jgi:opacity protein-like surface antigen
MRKALIVFVVFLMGGLTVAAQDRPKMEAFLGYSYVRFIPPSSSGVSSFGLNGGSGSVSYNLFPALGFVADFGGYRAGNISGVPVSLNMYTYMFGPKFKLRRGRFTPFVQALFGAAHGAVSASGSPSNSGNDFAMALGGGFDARVREHVAIRLIQAEYLNIRETGTSVNNARISAGIVFRFGE